MYQNNGPNSKGRKWEWDITTTQCMVSPGQQCKKYKHIIESEYVQLQQQIQ